MNDAQLLRYSRHIMLPQVGIEGQRRLLKSHVLLFGLGGLGAPIALYLAASGVGKLTLVDFDHVELSNLQRQIIHSTKDIGKDKVQSAQESCQQLNPEIIIQTVSTYPKPQELLNFIASSDLVIDATDNFSSRFALNQACVMQKTPLVSGAAIRMEGQVSVFRNDLDNSPCYRCLYSDTGEESQTCSDNGVLAPLVGIIGSIQALEAIKVLMNIGTELNARLLILDALNMEWRSMKLRKDPNCPVCSG
ncbi:MAG: molybdopterin-synthase adenylyltransferase MoeB [Gammaproteobacteria bacterium]|nr:molybdopterin-synthase adenylyltransferase MoeB [Gammaproteobacteria bacterium]